MYPKVSIMPFKIFTVSIRDTGPAETELNAFLASHRVLAVDRRWVEQGPDSFWSFCVDFMVQEASGPHSKHRAKPRGKDYKELLSPKDFAIYARLRELRKDIAQAEAVPTYTVFTNEQLAQMVLVKVRSKADLARIDGVGEARLEKYAARFLELLSIEEHDGQTEQGGDETEGTSA